MNDKLAATLAVALFGAVAMVPISEVHAQQKPYRLATKAETIAARSAVKRSLKDSESARFEGYEAMHSTGAVCGFVNSRNSYGGYVGTMPYAYVPTTGEVFFFQRGIGDAAERILRWLSYCPQ